MAAGHAGKPPLLVRRPVVAAIVQLVIVVPIAIAAMFTDSSVAVIFGVVILVLGLVAAFFSYRWFESLRVASTAYQDSSDK